MYRLLLAIGLVLAGCGNPPADAPAAESAPAEVSSRFVRPLDGDSVASPVGLVMEVQGLTLAPAGDMTEGTGHLHVMVDTLFVEAGQVIPKNDHHLHFGDASVEAQLELAPGEHVLRLQVGDGAHIALDGDEYRDEIRIVVIESGN